LHSEIDRNQACRAFGSKTSVVLLMNQGICATTIAKATVSTWFRISLARPSANRPAGTTKIRVIQAVDQDSAQRQRPVGKQTGAGQGLTAAQALGRQQRNNGGRNSKCGLC
jgi:hypothetical protein